MEDLGHGADISGLGIAVGDAVGKGIGLEAAVGGQMRRDDKPRMDPGPRRDRHQAFHSTAADGQENLLGQDSALSR